MNLYDTIIVGAGPAGLMAARELERSNVNYLILEAKDRIGYPLRCGETTREETFAELFSRRDYPFIRNTTSKILFRMHDAQKAVRNNMVMLDKAKFLQWLSEPVKDKLRMGTKLLEFKKDRNLAEIRTNKGILHAKMVILAVGTNFRIQKELNLINKNVELIPCIGGLFKNATLNRDTAYFLYDEDMYIAPWIFPKEERIFNAGAGIILKNRITEKLNLKTAFKKSMDRFGVTLEGEPSFGGNYVTNGPIHRTYYDRLLVCGDSAGQVYPGLGEGIYFALTAGRLAGQTAVNAVKNDSCHSEFLKTYETDWKKSFGRQMEAGLIFATILFFFMKRKWVSHMLHIMTPKEIKDAAFHGRVSVRLKIFYSMLKMLGCSAKR